MTGSGLNLERSLWLLPGGWIGRGDGAEVQIRGDGGEDRGDRTRVGEEQAERLGRLGWHDGLKGLMAAGSVDEGKGRRGPPDPGLEHEQPWGGRAVC